MPTKMCVVGQTEVKHAVRRRGAYWLPYDLQRRSVPLQASNLSKALATGSRTHFHVICLSPLVLQIP